MWKHDIKNKYNLTFSDIEKLNIGDRTKICEPLFYRDNNINAWVITENTCIGPDYYRYGSYDKYLIEIFDEDSDIKNKLKIECSSLGGTCKYKFKKFFSCLGIRTKSDFLIQEKLLKKINELIDNGILKK